MKRSAPPSALKAHCQPGPKSPTRCNSALNAAIPPHFVPYDSAVAFHKALKPRELANPQFRAAVGELAYSLYKKNKEEGLRSIATLENLCGLSQNESAVSYLRELAKSFGRDESASAPVPHSSTPTKVPPISRRILSAAASTSHEPGHVPAGDVPILSGSSRNGSSRNARESYASWVSSGNAPPKLSAGSAKAEDDTVRFSASVQSKLFDSSESPSTISEKGGRPEPADPRGQPRKSPARRCRARDSAAGGTSGAGTAKKSRISKRSLVRSSAHSSKHISNRDGDISSVPLEKSGSKKSLYGPAVPPVVQLQPHTKNVDKVRRKSKKGTGTPKRVNGDK